jgi:sulfur carrier protein ThiS adenylyltransferase
MPPDFDEIIRHYFTPGQIQRIKAAHIGIAGAGGLGSNCAMNLVRCGFERFTIVDFDCIEPSNLNRQAYFADQVGRPKAECLKENLRRINRMAAIKTLQVRLDEGNIPVIFGQCQVVVEAFDLPEMKALIVQRLLGSGKLIVSASGIAGFGESDRITVRKVMSDFYLIGDGRSGVERGFAPLAPCVAIAAAKQADVVLSWVLSGALIPPDNTTRACI